MSHPVFAKALKSAPVVKGRTSSTSAANGLRIGEPNDTFEQEADRVADEVLAGTRAPTWSLASVHLGQVRRQPAPTPSASALQRKCACGGTAGPDGECEQCKKKREASLQRKSNGAAGPSMAPPIVHEVLRSPGQPLDTATRRLFEPLFGHDFGHVRVHTGPQADKSARSVSAVAFTVGNHLVFGDGRFAPHSDPGKRLIAHELTHTLQQAGASHALSDTPTRLTGNGSLGPRVQRQGTGSGGSSCSAEICFASIKRFGLGTLGLKHAILNVNNGSSLQHAEVDPDFHQPAGMLHSHVVIAAGRKDGDSCQTLPATCAEASAMIAAANEYESKDVIYDPSTRTGPNSNSFAEWTLTKAGLKSGSVSVPFGASGWDYFNSNPAERTDPPHVIRGTPTPVGSSAKTATGAACTKAFKPATSAADYVALVREAETRMSAAGISTNPEKIKVLRGLYYGTPWSLDFAKEKSASRIAGFQTFTGTGVKYPRDPVSLFDCGLYEALQLSQDITAKSGKVDIGHLMIALDARNAAVSIPGTGLPPVSTPNLPFPGFGGSGVEIVTWLGDLGGGAASLALDRARSPKSPPPVSNKFTGTDYGAASNLEGDVAGFVVARGSGASSGGADVPAIPPGKGIADALDDYFGAAPAAASTAWDQRAKTFLTIYGGTFDAAGNLTNSGTVIDTFADKIESFACQYLAQRKADSSAKISDTEFLDAADNIRPCSREVAETFVNTLIDTSKTPGLALKATRFAATKPASPGACPVITGALRLKIRARQLFPLLPMFPGGGQ